MAYHTHVFTSPYWLRFINLLRILGTIGCIKNCAGLKILSLNLFSTEKSSPHHGRDSMHMAKDNSISTKRSSSHKELIQFLVGKEVALTQIRINPIKIQENSAPRYIHRSFKKLGCSVGILLFSYEFNSVLPQFG